MVCVWNIADIIAIVVTPGYVVKRTEVNWLKLVVGAHEKNMQVLTVLRPKPSASTPLVWPLPRVDYMSINALNAIPAIAAASIAIVLDVAVIAPFSIEEAHPCRL